MRITLRCARFRIYFDLIDLVTVNFLTLATDREKRMIVINALKYAEEDLQSQLTFEKKQREEHCCSMDE